MIGRRRGVVAVVLAAVALVLGVLVIGRLPGPTPEPGPTPSATAPSASATPDPDSATVSAYPGIPLLPGDPVDPVGRSTQSRLWAIDGAWYGSAVDPGTRESRIATLSADGTRWTDTGVLIDERAGAMVDALWDGEALLTISAVPGRSTDNGVRIARFQRGEDGRFVRDPNYPVPLTERGVSAATIARDSAGRLWAAFVQEGSVLVAHGTTNDAIWSAPGVLPGSGPVGDDDLAAVVATGDGRIAVVWSDAPASTVRAVLRADDAAPDAWDGAELAFADLPLASYPISVVAAEGTILVGIQTAVATAPGAGASDPDSIVAVRDPVGGWRTALTARVSDRLGYPLVLLDPTAGQVYAFQTSPRRGGTVHLKRSALDRLDFPAGRGLTVIDDPAHPEVTSLTASKGAVALADTFVIAGLDEATGIPWHALVGPPGMQPGPSATPTTASPTPGPTETAGRRLLIDDDFAPWAEGAPIGNGWELGPADARGSLVASGATSAERHARMRPATAAAIRACKAFPAVTSGDVVVDLDVRTDRLGSADAVITSVRDGSNEAASVRFGQGGTFAYYAGATKVRTTVRNRVERWLHSRVTVHLDTGRYDWRLTASDGTVIVRVRDIPFREPVEGVSSVCVGTSAGATRPVIRFDTVQVAH